MLVFYAQKSKSKHVSFSMVVHSHQVQLHHDFPHSHHPILNKIINIQLKLVKLEAIWN